MDGGQQRPAAPARCRRLLCPCTRPRPRSFSLDALRALKPKWKVSIAFMLQRLYRLEVLTDDKFVNSRKYLAQRGWLKTEPYDIETEPERPLLVRQMVEFIIDQGLHTRDQILNTTLYNPMLLEELMQVEQGYFRLGHPSFQMNLKLPPRRSAG